MKVPLRSFQVSGLFFFTLFCFTRVAKKNNDAALKESKATTLNRNGVPHYNPQCT